MARRAEAAGFDVISVFQDLFFQPAIFPLLAVARVTGETAPLLLTAFGLDAINTNPLKGAQSSLPLFVYKQVSSPYAPAIQRAWAGALTLIGVVLLLTVVARFLTRRNHLSA